MRGRGGAAPKVEPKRILVPIGHVASTARPGETVCGMPSLSMPAGHYCRARPASDEACLTCADLIARSLDA